MQREADPFDEAAAIAQAGHHCPGTQVHGGIKTPAEPGNKISSTPARPQEFPTPATPGDLGTHCPADIQVRDTGHWSLPTGRDLDTHRPADIQGLPDRAHTHTGSHTLPSAASLSRPGFTRRHELSSLQQWPVQLRLVPADAPFLKNSHIVLAADCAGFACADIQQKIQGKSLLIACPKLDDTSSYVQKLADIFRTAHPASLTILRMSVPCCGGLERLVQAALTQANISLPLEVQTVAAL